MLKSTGRFTYLLFFKHLTYAPLGRNVSSAPSMRKRSSNNQSASPWNMVRKLIFKINKLHLGRFPYHHLITFLVILFLLLLSIGAFSQGIQIEGNIKNDSGIPIAGVIVFEKGKKTATMSFKDGDFSLNVSNTNATLIFKKKGFLILEKSLKGKKVLNAVLKESVTDTYNSLNTIPDTLNFGDQYFWRRNNESEIVSFFQKEDFQGTENSIKDYLGNLPGVYIPSQNNQPGSGGLAFLRGQTSAFAQQPLYVVDGVIQNAGLIAPDAFKTIDPLHGLNVKDIDKVLVLRGNEASSIYGSQGANGVVHITTKKGNADSLIFNYQGQTGINFTTSSNNLLSSNSYFAILNESLNTAGLDTFPNISHQAPNKWIDVILRMGLYIEHTLSLSGGSQNSKFYLSGNYKLDEGVMLASQNSSGGIRLNHSWQLIDGIKSNINFRYAESNQVAQVYHKNHWFSNPIIYASVYPPFKNNYSPILSQFGHLDPVDLIKNQPIINSQSLFTGKLSVEFDLSRYLNFHTFDISRYLSFHTSLGGSYNDNTQSFDKLYDFTGYNSTADYVKKYRTGNVYNWKFSNFLRFQKLHGQDQWLVILGSEEQYLTSRLNANYTFSHQFTERPDENLMLTGTNSLRTSSLYAKINYAQNSKFDLSLFIRREKILRQYGVNKFGLFPSFSAGYWIFNHRELPQNILSALKIKTSWGVPGANSFHFFNTEISGAGKLTEKVYSIENKIEPFHPNAPWEISQGWNFGLESYWMGRDLSLNINYFDYLRKNVSFLEENSNKPFSYNWMHTARVHNAGYELELNYRKDFGDKALFGNFFIQSTSDRVLDLGEDYTGDKGYLSPSYPNNGNFTVMKEGEPLYSFWGYRSEGIINSRQEIEYYNNIDGNSQTYYQEEATSPGDLLFTDIDKNGIINAQDKTVIGNPFPDFNYKILLGAVYKGFDVSLVFDGAAGYDILNLDKTWSQASGGWGNRAAEMRSFWRPENFEGTIPRIHFYDPNRNNRIHSGMVEDGSYFTWRKFDIGYRFKNLKSTQLRLYLSLQSVLSSGKNDKNPTTTFTQRELLGVSYGNYPFIQTITAGIQLGI